MDEKEAEARPLMGTIFLVPLYIILPEICAFITGICCTVWTKIRTLLAH